MIKMKQYLMNGLAVLVLGTAFVACGEKDLYDPVAAANRVVKNYEQKFTQTFGNPSSDQDWGFGAMPRATRSGNTTGVDPVAETSTGINANANEWADAADAPHGHGGWLVPDPLTQEQKDIVAAYFQTHPNLDYVDPQWPNFFVQQVYKGDSIVKHGDTTEGIVATNGSKYASGTMNKLTVGKNHQHINNFNGGTATSVNVLDNGYTANEADNHSHPDQIMLMVNIDDTECMGYHSSGASVQRDDKAALVGWQTIADWATANGMNGNCLNDGWDRSFVGFDLALLNKDESTLKDANGNPVNAKFTDGQNSALQYVWDGTNVLIKGPVPEATEASEVDITSTFANNVTGAQNATCTTDESGNIVVTFSGENYNSIQFDQKANWNEYDKLVIEFAEPAPFAATIYSANESAQIAVNDTRVEVSAKTDYTWSGGPNITNYGVSSSVSLKIKKVTLVKNATEAGDPADYYTSEYLLANGKEVPFLITNGNQFAGEPLTISDNDMKYTTTDGKVCFNMKKIEELVEDGYLPKLNTNLREWVKFEYGDGYFSDWIVTLTEAKRQVPQLPSIRVMAEDLSVSEASDFDFNDIVIDFEYKSATEVSCTLQAAGGTLPLRINENDNLEVHKLFGVATNIMVNTNASRLNREGNYYADKAPVSFTIAGTFSNDENTFKQQINAIKIEVEKETETGKQWILIEANQGKVAGKIGCPVGTDWCDEKVQISKVYPKFAQYIQDPTVKWWIK